MPDSAGRKFTYVQDRWTEVSVAPGERRKVIDSKESGELVIVEFHTHSSKLAMEINLWSDDGSMITIMDFHHDFDALLELGWGLTPGAVAPIAGISPDPTGIPNGVHPFLTRYKSTSETDVLGETGQHYSMSYAPVVAIPYGKRIQISVFNPTQDAHNIHDLVVNRRVYARLGSSSSDR